MPSGQTAHSTPQAVHTVNTILTNATAIEAGSHSAILQFLDRSVGGMWLAADQFAASVDSWAGVPIIFAQPPHPNFDAFDADADAELTRINGRLAGAVVSPRIEAAGHPRLVADLSFAGDEEVEALCQAGRLSLSTAFRAQTDGPGTAITSPPRPHHVLVFTEEPGRAMPVDPGAVILNATAPPMDITNAGRELSAKNIGRLQALSDALNGAREALKELLGGTEPKGEPVANAEPAQEPAPEPEPEPIQDTDMTDTEGAAAITNAVAEKEAELANARTENAALKAELAKVEQAHKDAEWTAFKNAEIPVGWTDTAEKEAELRTLAETRPLEFAKKIATIPRPDATKTVEEGSEFAHAAAADESLAITRELRTATGTLR
jgi:hypothetical protein